MFCAERVHTSPTSPGPRSAPVSKSTTFISTHLYGFPAERKRWARGPPGSWSSGVSSVMAPVVSVMPNTCTCGHFNVFIDAIKTSSVIGDAP